MKFFRWNRPSSSKIIRIGVGASSSDSVQERVLSTLLDRNGRHRRGSSWSQKNVLVIGATNRGFDWRCFIETWSIWQAHLRKLTKSFETCFIHLFIHIFIHLDTAAWWNGTQTNSRFIPQNKSIDPSVDTATFSRPNCQLTGADPKGLVQEAAIRHVRWIVYVRWEHLKKL